MNQRERILAVGVALLLGYFPVQWTVRSQFLEPLRTRDGELERLTTQVEQKRQDLKKAKQSALELERWRALGADHVIVNPRRKHQVEPFLAALARAR